MREVALHRSKVFGPFLLMMAVLSACADEVEVIDQDISDQPYAFLGECPILSSHGWRAEIIPSANEGDQKVLEVTANVTTPVPDFLFTWRDRGGETIAKPKAEIEIEMLPPIRRVNDIVTSQRVSYRSPTSIEDYDEITIRCAGDRVAVINEIENIANGPEKSEIVSALDAVRGARILSRKTSAQVEDDKTARKRAAEAEQAAVLAAIAGDPDTNLTDAENKADAEELVRVAQGGESEGNAAVAAIVPDEQASEEAASTRMASADRATRNNGQSSMAYIKAALETLDETGASPERHDHLTAKTVDPSAALAALSSVAQQVIAPFRPALDPKAGAAAADANTMIAANEDDGGADVAMADAAPVASEAPQEIAAAPDALVELVTDPSDEPARTSDKPEVTASEDDSGSSMAYIRAALENLDENGAAPKRFDHFAKTHQTVDPPASVSSFTDALRGLMEPVFEFQLFSSAAASPAKDAADSNADGLN